MSRPTTEEMFWQRVDMDTEPDCWIWTGFVRKYKNGKAYGAFKSVVNGKERNVAAKKYSLQLSGVDMVERPQIHTSCGNSLCVNPEHLSVIRSRSLKRPSYYEGGDDKSAVDEALIERRPRGLIP